MRAPAFIACLLLIGCQSAPRTSSNHADPTAQPWYTDTLKDVNTLIGGVRQALHDNHPDAASALIQRGEPMAARLLAVPRPTLEATEAASDLDELYAQMLFSNSNYGWARLMFQKNLSRWKYWKPATPETERRLKRARDQIAECDRKIEGSSR
ncbi:MAG: hypothetical protein KGN84_12700 [Acidobacteriota bacterium]|nr:hypothetical protein [Acidobacteriota bacterium]